MKIKIINIGKTKNSSVRELEDYYMKLARKYFQIEIIITKDIRNRMIDYSDIRKYFTKDMNIILSEDGEEFSTIKFAEMLNNARLKSVDLTFFIANAFGFTENVKFKGNLTLSLSKMTFPHELVRIILLEQLFRCGDYLAHGKYHK